MDSLSDIQFLFALLIIFQIKQFIGDYVLQTGWMVVGKGRADLGFVFPLSVHVGVHALLTLGIVYYLDPSLWYLALFDFGVHFTMDRIKSAPNLLGRFNDTSKSSFWIPMGFDQMVHHLTHYAIIYWLLIQR
ncbi:MAG: hypothetical protein Tsb0010_11060 [Parvularculaceae bacterium]